jgi:putative membrane protein
MVWSGKYRFSAFIIVLFHLAGWIGMDRSSYAMSFEQVSWANILLSFILLLWCHEPNNEGFRLVGFVSAVILLGMLIEIVGVRTGIIFGAYHYTPVLGPTILGVPVIIGINWTMLTYVAAVTSSLFPMPLWMKVIAGSLIMVFCDLLLEGFAIRHHFWVWEGGAGPPLTNYIGWFIVSLLSNAIFIWLIPDTKNKLGPFYLSVFLIFLVADKLI